MPIRSSSRGGSRKRQQTNLLGIVLLSSAIVFGAFLVSSKKSSNVQAAVPANVVVAQFDTVSVPVPVEPVAAGTRLRDIRFKNISFPRHQVPEGALLKIEGTEDSVTVNALPANLPLFSENLSRDLQGMNPVLEKIPAGMRAMTVKVDATAAVEGWAGSGSMVDVLLVEKNRTTVVAELVKILSAERSVAPVEGSAAPSVPSTVTLLVSQEQCLAINTAIPLGKIAFALRSNKDTERWTSTHFTAESLKGSSLVKDRKGIITGYVAAGGASEERSYALTDGKWIETEVVPEGFLISKKPKKDGPSTVSAGADAKN